MVFGHDFWDGCCGANLKNLQYSYLLDIIYTPIYSLIYVDLFMFLSIIYSIKYAYYSTYDPSSGGWKILQKNLQALRQEQKLHDQRRVIAGALQVQLRRRAAACM